MSTRNDIREVVRDRYAAAARRVTSGQGGACCGTELTSTDPITRDLYAEDETADLPEDAVRASLGCGNPTALADLHPGETVLDLGSGGGIDVLLSARRVGAEGKAYGLDMTDEMLKLARKNQQAAGVDNVEFLKGTMEEIPLPDASVDVVISNCVINLSADKDRVLREVSRVLRPGGRFAVTDVVLRRPLPEPVRRSMELWAGCVAGALLEDEYRAKLADAGFDRITVEPVRVYSRDDTVEAMGGSCCGDESPASSGCCDDSGSVTIDPVEVDGALMSAFVRAVKP